MSASFNKKRDKRIQRQILFSLFLCVAIVSLFVVYILLSLQINIHYAYGHALPVSYSPAPNSIINRTDLIPSKVIISFSERPDPKVSSIEVLNSNNQRVDNNDFKITGQQNNRQASISLDKNKLTEGIYTVSWLTMSADDGHIAKGSYIFGIENVGGSTSTSTSSSVSSSKSNNKFNVLSQQNQIKTEAVTSDIDGLIKWPLIVAQSAIVGGIISHLFLWTNNRIINRILVSATKDKSVLIKDEDHKNIKQNKSPDPGDTNSINATIFKPLKVFVLVLCICSASVFICGTTLIFLQIIDLSTSNSTYLSIFISLLNGPAGQVWIIRSLMSLIVIVTSLFYFYTEKKKIKSEINGRNGNSKIGNSSNYGIKRNPFVLFLFIALVAGAVGIFANSMTSHSSAVTFLPFLAISLDWLHFMAVSIWVGGLFYISTVLLTLAKSNILVDSIKIKTKPDNLSNTTTTNYFSSTSEISKNKNKYQSTLPDKDPSATNSSPHTNVSRNFSPITKGDYFLALLLPRFSLLATISLGIIGVSGLYMAWIHLHSFNALFDTQYGTTLIVKLLTILPVVILGGYHQLILHNYMLNLAYISKKRGYVKEEKVMSYKEKKGLGFLSNKIKTINNRISKEEIKSSEVYAKFSKTIKIESILAIVVLFFASILTITSPPASMNMPSMMTMMGDMGSIGSSTNMTSNNMNANTMNHNQSSSILSPQATKNPNTAGQKQENSSYTTDVKIMDTNTNFQINPFYAGFNTFKVTFTGADGKPAKDVSNVILQFTNDEADIGPIVVTLNKVSEGAYSTFGGYLSQKGNWTIQLTAQRVNAYDLNNEFDVSVKQKPPLSPISSPSSLSNTVRLLNMSASATATDNTNTMNPHEYAPSFDSFAILAIILSGLVIFGSTYYFRKSKQQLQKTLKMFETEYKE
ncbi:MAG: copper resistance CopC/CopD family protein [Candidatus Nitrosocosmicus sp.]